MTVSTISEELRIELQTLGSHAVRAPGSLAESELNHLTRFAADYSVPAHHVDAAALEQARRIARRPDSEARRRMFLLGHRAGRDVSALTDAELAELIEHGSACRVHSWQIHAARDEQNRRAEA